MNFVSDVTRPQRAAAIGNFINYYYREQNNLQIRTRYITALLKLNCKVHNVTDTIRNEPMLALIDEGEH